MRTSPPTLCCSFFAISLASSCDRPGAPEKMEPIALSSPAVQTSDSSTTAAPAKRVEVKAVELLPALKTYVEDLPASWGAIPEERQRQLDKLALFIKTRRDSGETARVVYICTHNSRRSHMGQLFAALAAAHYGVDRVETFSGGTEVTALNRRTAAALERAGFAIENPGGDNPHYQIRFSENRPAVEAFSKKYDDEPNPKQGFAAVMTCSHADVNCPTVLGAGLRIPLHYEDPKESDDTPEEAANYDARARQIATEAFYVFSKVKG